MSKNVFFEFLRDWRTTGTIAPSSPRLVAALTDPIDPAQTPLAVELGPGTGCVTRALLDRLAPEARLLAVEINSRFATALTASMQDSRLVVATDSAARLPAILQELGLPAPTWIVSGLPFASLPVTLREDIVIACHQALPVGGRLIAFQYAPLVLPPLLTRHFGGFSVRRVLLNLPPALVYTSVKR